MNYCKFENTYFDLKDCFNNWNECDSESELQFQAKLLLLCARITAFHSKELDKPALLKLNQDNYDMGLITTEEYNNTKLSILSN